jgi:hypothetical protein
MGVKSTYAVAALLTLGALGCSGHGGGGGGGSNFSGATGASGSTAATYHLSVTTQPATPLAGDPVAITVAVVDNNNNAAAVASGATVTITGATVGLQPRAATGTFSAGVSAVTVSARIATVGTYTLNITCNTNATPGVLTANPTLIVGDHAYQNTTTAEVQIDAGGPGIGGFAFASLAAVDSQVACTFCDERLQGMSHVFVNGSVNGGGSFTGALQVDHAPGGTDCWDASAAVNGTGLLAVAWCDERGLPDGQVFANVSANNGTTFGADVRVDAAASRTGPCSSTQTAVAGGNIYVAWIDQRDTTGQMVYVAGSANGGQSFSELRLDGHTAGSSPWSVAAPISLAASGGDVCVLWTEQQGNTTNVVIASSQNGGATFGRATLNTVPTAHVFDAQLVASGGALYAAWRDDRLGPATSVFTSASQDGGATWGGEVSIPFGAAKTQLSALSVAAAGANVFVFAGAQDQGASQVTPESAVSLDAGSTFQPAGTLPQGTTDSVRVPQAGAQGGAVFASWNEVTYTSGERGALATGGTYAFGTAAKISTGAAPDGLFARSRAVAATGGRFYILWEEARGTPSSPYNLRLVVAQ